VTPFAALTRHFIENAAGRAWLDDEGVAGLRGVFFFAVAGLGTLGLFLPRRFSRQYWVLDGVATPEPYQQALFADSLFMLALPAIVAGWMAILLAPAMFPDETDYVALGSLPLTRRQLFGAKLLALVLIVAAVIGTMILVFGVAFPSFSHSRWADASRPARILAHLAAGAASAAFAVLAVMALHGVMLLAVPRRWLASLTAAVQSALMAGLVLTLPLVFRALTARAWLATDPPVLLAAPPAWFLGLQQVLLGGRDPFEVRLASIGGVAFVVAAATAAACYLLLYRRVESLLAPADRARTARRRREARASRPAPWRAVWAFTFATLARSRQSQMLFLIVWAAGAAIAVNVVLGSDPGSWLASGRRSPSAVAAAVIAPLPLVVLGILGARAAFLLPVSPHANWIFRMLDLPDRRAGHLRAVERALFALGVLPALALCAPLEIAALGLDHGARVLVLAAGVGLIVIEMVLASWRRIPFTCSWIPGKRPLPLMMVATIGAVQAVTLATGLIYLALRSAAAFLIVAGLLFVPALGLRIRRRARWASQPLQFEDDRPDRLQTLGLTSSGSPR
jgi:hypothetical protein